MNPRASSDPLFSAPERGFVSSKPASDWQQAILTGNGTIGALVLGNPCDETIYLSHESLYLPNPSNPHRADLASRLDEIRSLCLAGDYDSAGKQIEAASKTAGYCEDRDPYIAACALHIKQPEAKVARYQRTVDFMTAETMVSVADESGGFRRSAFASRADDVLVLRLAGRGKQSAEFFFTAIEPANDNERRMVAGGVKSSEQGVKDGLLYFRTLFAHENPHNPNIGYEVLGKILSQGGQRTATASGIRIAEADEILVLVKIRPLLKRERVETNFAAVEHDLAALGADYDKLLARHAKLHGDLMGRVSLSLEASEEDRAKPSEQLNKDSAVMEAPLAKIERVFDAGRYNIICSTGHYPPNLQGLWAGTWAAPWSGSMTTNGNLPVAVAFLLMGNTPELMHAYFRYHDERWPGFRQNAKEFFGARGFHVPAQLTVSPLATDFNPRWPHCFWHGGAPWALEFYYDYYRITGDREFLAGHAYPLMKEACAFFEDFLTVTDANGNLVLVPDYSPENAPGGEEMAATAINSTMDVAAARQLLGNTIAAARMLGRDADLQEKWAAIIDKLPPYEVAPDGCLREWLWPGLEESHCHRHASHLYALYDRMPDEIVKNPALVKAVTQTIRERMKFRAETRCGMAFGIVHLGLAAAHIGDASLTQDTINMLAKYFWTDGMASFHDWEDLFNIDISGGFPYLCASALVYGDPGSLRFFPARPPQWIRGSLRGVRVRGGIVVRELTWDGPKAKAVLVADADQTISIECPDREARSLTLQGGVETMLEL